MIDHNELAPKDAPVNQFHARLLTRARHWPEAAAAWRKTATLSPTEAENWLGLGDTAYEANLKGECNEGYEHFIPLASPTSDLRGIKPRLEELKAAP